MPKVKVAIRSKVKSCMRNYSKTTEANLMKLHRYNIIRRCVVLKI